MSPFVQWQYARLSPHPFYMVCDDSFYRLLLQRQQHVLLSQESFSGFFFNQLVSNLTVWCSIRCPLFSVLGSFIGFCVLCTCRWAKYSTSWGVCDGPWGYCLPKLWSCSKHAGVWKIGKIIRGILSKYFNYLKDIGICSGLTDNFFLCSTFSCRLLSRSKWFSPVNYFTETNLLKNELQDEKGFNMMFRRETGEGKGEARRRKDLIG